MLPWIRKACTLLIFYIQALSCKKYIIKKFADFLFLEESRGMESTMKKVCVDIDVMTYFSQHWGCLSFNLFWNCLRFFVFWKGEIFFQPTALVGFYVQNFHPHPNVLPRKLKGFEMSVLIQIFCPRFQMICNISLGTGI